MLSMVTAPCGHHAQSLERSAGSPRSAGSKPASPAAVTYRKTIPGAGSSTRDAVGIWLCIERAQGNLSLCEGENVIPYLALLCIFFCKHKTVVGSKNCFSVEVTGSRRRWNNTAVTNKVGRAHLQRQGRCCPQRAAPTSSLPRAGVTERLGSSAAGAGAKGVLHTGAAPKSPRARASGAPWAGTSAWGPDLCPQLSSFPVLWDKQIPRARGRALPAAAVCRKRRLCCKGKGKNCAAVLGLQQRVGKGCGGWPQVGRGRRLRAVRAPPKRCVSEQKWLTNLHMARGSCWRPQIELG